MALNPENGQRIGRKALLTALKGLVKTRVKAVDIDEYVKNLRDESDRGAMILAATLIDDALLTALERKTPNLNSRLRDIIFSGDGSLSSFSKRINFAEASGTIDADTATMIHTIRDIRNAAAHAHTSIDFSTKQVVELLATVVGINERISDFETWPRTNVRNYYLQICGFLADLVVNEDSSPDHPNAFVRTLRASDWSEHDPSRNISPVVERLIDLGDQTKPKP